MYLKMVYKQSDTHTYKILFLNGILLGNLKLFLILKVIYADGKPTQERRVNGLAKIFQPNTSPSPTFPIPEVSTVKSSLWISRKTYLYA